MFSKEQISAYQNVSAPSELRNKVLDACLIEKQKRSHGPLGSLAVLAACLILCIGLSLHHEAAEPEIFCNGQELSDSVLFYDISPASDMRTSPVFSIPFEFSLEQETEISVSRGSLVLSDGSYVQRVTMEGDQTLWWEIPREDEMPECEMLLTEKEDYAFLRQRGKNHYGNQNKSFIKNKNK